MKSRSYFHIAVFCLLNFLPCFGFAQSGERLAFVAGRYFEVVGTDNRSVSFANQLGEHVVDLCESYLQAGSHAFPQSIFVALRPEERVEFEGDYQIQVGARGQVSLDFRWEASLELETVCHAFVEAYLVRYLNYNYGPSASDKMRFWALSALSSQSYLSLRPAQKIQFIREGRDVGVLKIPSLLTLDVATARQNNVSERQGYWVLDALRNSGLTRNDVGALLDRALAGMDLVPTFESEIELIDADQQVITLDTWWEIQLAASMSQDDEYYETLDASRVWLTELANFDTYRASGGDLKNIMSLWADRSDAALREVITARREIIALRIERVNPAYFNTAQSLGALYETALEAESKFEFIHALTAYLSDWEDTKRLHDKIYELLDAR